MPLFDDKDECGIGPITTGQKDYFKSVCSFHDRMYVLKEEGKQPMSRKEVDKRFLKGMLILAGNNILYKTQAYIYYGITRALGWIPWRY